MNGKVRDLLRKKRLTVSTSADYETKNTSTVQDGNQDATPSTESSTDDESCVEYRVKSTAKAIGKIQERSILEDDWAHPDDYIAAEFEGFGSTPPRTRMKIKSRDWDRKQKSTDIAPKRGLSRLARSRVCRRNTMDCALLNEIFIDEETKRNDKRALALLRDAERDIKNSVDSRASYHETHHTESVESSVNLNAGSRISEVPTFIESCNRYMSVSSRRIGCRSSAPPLAFAMNLGMDSGEETPALHSRKEFHETFANLIKLGSTDRQEIKPTQEEHTWQAELKDLIWLELQAWQADRTMEQQDRYLLASRQGVPDLLKEIMNYKFRPKFERMQSTISTDSGLSSGSCSDHPSAAQSPSVPRCDGCMSLYCKDCTEQQATALKEVEDLLSRVEAAEALYPSSKVMGTFHPIYRSQEFVGRIKAMCLWYNITRQTRLKLIILGKILTRLQGEKFSWPIQTSVTESSSSSSGHENDDSAVHSVDSKGSGMEHQRIPKVQFQLDELATTTSDTSSSNESTSTGMSQGSAEYHELSKRVDDLSFFNVEPLANVTYDNVKNSTVLYRKFIENVLKSRGLAKALSFLHRLHNIVLHKAQISLEKLGAEEYDFETESLDPDFPRLDPVVSREQIEELRRYGKWSEEAQMLALPSYVPIFVFLSIIPLEFMHEFLRMRLETRPQKPNPLSLKQLMKELREGLTLALTHRERYQRHITTAFSDNEAELEKYLGILDQFDSTVRTVFELYLDYVDQTVLVASSETNQKSALEKEWIFTKLVSPMINGMHTVATKKFCLIIRNLLHGISDRLVTRAQELNIKMEGTSHCKEAKKLQLFKICRETQSLFTVERERAVKVLLFAKTFCRDVEQSDFHREHYEEYLTRNKNNNFSCPAVKQEFKLVQRDVLDVRRKLTHIIEGVQMECCLRNIVELDEQDRQAVLSRSREILHQGYKFGFEYNKDVIRLFEQKIMQNRDEMCDSDLALGIIGFAKMWMQFVTERCERGRGVRPRWASQGLEFLILACDPQITRYLNDKEFEDLKNKMDCCISHVIGITSEPEKTKKRASPRTRKTSSPAASRSRTPTRTPLSAGIIVNAPQKFLHPQFSLKEEGSCKPDYLSVDTPDCENSSKPRELRLIVPSNTTVDSITLRQIRVRDAVNRLDMEIEDYLRDRNLIGQVKALSSCDKIHIRARSVNFRWHRGIKIGQGRFGKVYTAVNNSSGELMAMKEIAIQPGETRALKNVAEELKILEGIKHKNLVRYYGIEVHREELLIFMELCSEGTLESLVEMLGALPEGLTRRFTAQLLSSVAELHRHGIVHRDIKTANIFLVDGSNSLKLGDFGSAVKIQAHTTVPGELQGYVGTQAYMAPEVFTKSNSDGHGRAADIWSVGCVVVEMASGKRPWSQYDSNFQIMFKVGMGEAPGAPESLSQEGHDFIQKALQHDPKTRWTANTLLDHNFCKVGLDEECKSESIQDVGRGSLRRNRN